MQKNPIRERSSKMLSEARRRCKKSGLPVEVTLDYIVELARDKCPILGIRLAWEDDERKIVCPHSPTLDRIDNAKGYVEGNLQIISHKANMLKGNATLEELIRIGDWARCYTTKD